MKWLLRGLAALALTLVGLAALVVSRAESTERPVGFEVVRTTDARGRTVPIAVWYPTSATPWPTVPLGLVLMRVAHDGPVAGEKLPLVVISHGNQGGPGSHADLAMALANAGYVVAAPMHSGDNVEDASGVGTAGFWSGRNQELRATIDFLTSKQPDSVGAGPAWRAHERLDPTRIAAFGFSAGGFTVLTAIGAKPELSRIATHCAAKSEFACQVLEAAHSPLRSGTVAPIDLEFFVDSRIRAAVIAAPGLGFTFGEHAFDEVRVPVQLWTGGLDTSVPDESNTAMVRAGLAGRIEAHAEPNVSHLSFLAPCSLLQPAPFCSDPEGFDRRAFHQRMNAEVLRFLGTTLKVTAPE